MSSAGPAEAFTSREQAYLSSLPAVEHVTSGRIYYTEAFKKECVRRYRAGESASRIFEEAGLSARLIGYKRIERSVARWNKSIPDSEPAQYTLCRNTAVVRPFELSEMTACIRRIEERLNNIESTLGIHSNCGLTETKTLSGNSNRGVGGASSYQGEKP